MIFACSTVPNCKLVRPSISNGFVMKGAGFCLEVMTTRSPAEKLLEDLLNEDI